MHAGPKYSIIIPVYNRPDEIDELLRSLTKQSFTNFEVLIIEDGSTVTCESVYEKYTNELEIRYFFKPNSGPGPSRNFGYQQARGDYFIVFDSDCIIPQNYLQNVDDFLKVNYSDAWGGPDRGHTQFTMLQQAMAYTMSSVLTTGGIRGGKTSNRKFQPRSFNMGISRKVFEATGGFRFDRYAEDIEFSIRMRKLGFKVDYIDEAYVFHKRRTTLRQFYRQVFNFGRGRVQVGKVHTGAIQVTHWFPSLFLMGWMAAVLLLIAKPMIGAVMVVAYILYLLAIAIGAFRFSKSVVVGLLAVPSALVQLCGYGAGFLREMMVRS